MGAGGRSLRGRGEGRRMLTAITGPMFSGKTTELLRRFKETSRSQLFKPKLDDRYSDSRVVSHGGIGETATVVRGGWDIRPNAGIEHVFIDEAQFFDMDIVLRLEELLRLNYSITVAGLDLDYRGREFNEMGAILALSDEVIKLAAICSECLLPARRTKRLTDGVDVVMVGGSEAYAPVCVRCHSKEKEYE